MHWDITAAILIIATLGYGLYSLNDRPDAKSPSECSCEQKEEDCTEKVFSPKSKRVRLVYCAIWNNGRTSCCVVHFNDRRTP